MLAKSFDTICKTVYTYNVITENQRQINNKMASNTFLLMMFASILLQLIVGMIIDSEVIDAGDFFVLAGLTAVQYLLYIAIFIFVCKQYRIGPRVLFKQTGLDQKIEFKTTYTVMLLAGLCLVGIILVSGALTEFFRVIGYLDAYNPERVDPMSINSFSKYFVAVVVFAFVPAIVEELFFRGIILKGLLQFGRSKAAVASAVLFSLFHLNPEQTVHQFVLGIVLALVVLQTGKLMYAMILHFVNNFSILTYTYIAGEVYHTIPWNVFTIVLTVILAGASALFIVRLIKDLGKDKQSSSSNSYQIKGDNKKFFSFDNILYFFGVILVGSIWLLLLFSGIGFMG